MGLAMTLALVGKSCTTVGVPLQAEPRENASLGCIVERNDIAGVALVVDDEKVPSVCASRQVRQGNGRLPNVTACMTDHVGYTQCRVQGKDLVLGDVRTALRIGARHAERNACIARSRGRIDGGIRDGRRLAQAGGPGRVMSATARPPWGTVTCTS